MGNSDIADLEYKLCPNSMLHANSKQILNNAACMVMKWEHEILHVQMVKILFARRQRLEATDAHNLAS